MSEKKKKKENQMSICPSLWHSQLIPGAQASPLWENFYIVNNVTEHRSSVSLSLNESNTEQIEDLILEWVWRHNAYTAQLSEDRVQDQPGLYRERVNKIK